MKCKGIGTKKMANEYTNWDSTQIEVNIKKTLQKINKLNFIKLHEVEIPICKIDKDKLKIDDKLEVYDHKLNRYVNSIIKKKNHNVFKLESLRYYANPTDKNGSSAKKKKFKKGICLKTYKWTMKGLRNMKTEVYIYIYIVKCLNIYINQYILIDSIYFQSN